MKLEAAQGDYKQAAETGKKFWNGLRRRKKSQRCLKGMSYIKAKKENRKRQSENTKYGEK